MATIPIATQLTAAEQREALESAQRASLGYGRTNEHLIECLERNGYAIVRVEEKGYPLHGRDPG